MYKQQTKELLIKVAFISDAGMTGPYLSSLGCDLDSVITRMRGLSSKFLISEN